MANLFNNGDNLDCIIFTTLPTYVQGALVSQWGEAIRTHKCYYPPHDNKCSMVTCCSIAMCDSLIKQGMLQEPNRKFF